MAGGILKQAELSAPVADLIRKVGISEQTFYRLKKVHGGLEPSQARKPKQLEEENAKLKRLVADLSLDKVMLQDVVKKSGETGGATRHGPLSPGKLRHQRASGLQGGGLPEIELPV